MVGRRMRPLNPADGVAEQFACELRALRAAAGEPAFWKMARRCAVSKSALAAAVAGYELPSERVTSAFVQVCGGDWPWWSERLAQARVELEASPAAPATGSPPPGTALVPTRRMPPALPVRAMARGQLIPLADPAVNRAAGKRRRLAALTLVGAVALGATVLIIEFLPRGHPPAAAIVTSPAPRQASGGYDQTVGPGCPSTTLAKIAQDDFSQTHQWTQATAAHWNVAGCSNLILYSSPTAASDPDRWQDDYEWDFDNVPKNAQCTFRIYIPDSSYAEYTATYDWTEGGSNYLDSTAFVIDQSGYRGQWYNQGPHVFSTGQATMMITDARSHVPNAPLSAAAVRLTCK